MTLKIRLAIQDSLKTFVDKLEIAKYISKTIERRESNRLPYKSNSHNDNIWIVDSGNDWRVIFDNDDSCVFYLWHRYDNIEARDGLTRWIAFSLHAKTFEDPVSTCNSLLTPSLNLG